MSVFVRIRRPPPHDTLPTRVRNIDRSPCRPTSTPDIASRTFPTEYRTPRFRQNRQRKKVCAQQKMLPLSAISTAHSSVLCSARSHRFPFPGVTRLTEQRLQCAKSSHSQPFLRRIGPKCAHIQPILATLAPSHPHPHPQTRPCPLSARSRAKRTERATQPGSSAGSEVDSVTWPVV